MVLKLVLLVLNLLLLLLLLLLLVPIPDPRSGFSRKPKLCQSLKILIGNLGGSLWKYFQSLLIFQNVKEWQLNKSSADKEYFCLFFFFAMRDLSKFPHVYPCTEVASMRVFPALVKKKKKMQQYVFDTNVSHLNINTGSMCCQHFFENLVTKLFKEKNKKQKKQNPSPRKEKLNYTHLSG